MEFLSSNIETNTGYFSLQWKNEGEEIVLFQQKSTEWFQIYEGGNDRIALSGLSDGSYSYAICPQKTVLPSREACSYTDVKVEHFSQIQTATALGFGVSIFLSLIIALVYFQFRDKEKASLS